MNSLIRIVDPSRIIVTAVPEDNPLRKLKSITIELIKKEFKGTVIFDLLVFNGTEVNRFVIIPFNGYEFDKQHISYAAHIEHRFEVDQNRFFIEHKDFLENSVLSSYERNNFSY